VVIHLANIWLNVILWAIPIKILIFAITYSNNSNEILAGINNTQLLYISMVIFSILFFLPVTIKPLKEKNFKSITDKFKSKNYKLFDGNHFKDIYLRASELLAISISLIVLITLLAFINFQLLRLFFIITLLASFSFLIFLDQKRLADFFLNETCKTITINILFILLFFKLVLLSLENAHDIIKTILSFIIIRQILKLMSDVWIHLIRLENKKSNIEILLNFLNQTKNPI
jgi:hypothetical protein